MKKVFKLLSRSIVPILVVVALLYIQVRLELKLPEYTSNIVNVGIQQNGITDNVYEVIRESEYNKLLLLASNNADKISSYYEKKDISEKKYFEDNGYNTNESIYIIKDINKDEREKLNTLLYKPISIISLMNYSEANPDAKNEEKIDENMSIDEVIDSLDKNLVNQMNINQVKSEYEIIGKDLGKMQSSYLFNSGLMMVLVAFGIMIIAIVIAYLSSKVGSKFSRDLRSQVTNKVMSFSNAEFNAIGTASLITRSTNDIQRVQMLVILALRLLLYAPMIGLGALDKVSDSPLAWTIGIVVLLIFALVIVLLIVAMPKFKSLQKLVDKLNLVSREILTGLPVIRAFANEKREEARFDVANTDLTKTNLFVDKVMALMMPTMNLIMNATCVLIIWVGAEYIDAATIQVGTLMAFISYTMQIIMSFLMITVLSVMLPRAFVSLRRLAEVLNMKNSIKEKETTIKFPKDFKGEIEFKDVYFRYPDASEDVLQNISFKVEAGSTTAFIGSTGSGKSTLINLLPRFFDITGGKILLDGINISDVKLSALRDKLGYVPQKGILFTGDVKENIKFGNASIKLEDIEIAAKVAQADDFISKLEDGYDSPISQGGTNVSGGQKQRLSIARAIAKDPDILIFDDSFSALDFKTDASLRKAIKKELKGKTTLIVASRIATIMDADQIIVMDKGEIVGIGRHKELLKTNEVYKEIAYSQLSEEELNNA